MLWRWASRGFAEHFLTQTFEPTSPPYDLLVIGGGINGVGIARDAAGRGLSVLLLERADLASATSSVSRPDRSAPKSIAERSGEPAIWSAISSGVSTGITRSRRRTVEA